MLSGEPGIGKTLLWETGIRASEKHFARVLSCRGVEAEASLAFAALSELIEPVLGEVAATLVRPRRRALEVALLLVEPGEHVPDPHAIGLAVLDVLRALVAVGPVLIALDDAQWLDPGSAGALQLALRRLRTEPLGVLAALRVAPELAPAFPLNTAFAEERFVRLSLGPLDAEALHAVLQERLALELTRPELTRVWEATAGNPYFALELGRELVRTGTRPAPGQPLHVPESLRELLGGRLARLPTETGDVLLQVAALARPTVELVTTAHGDRNRVLEALDAAVRENVIVLDDSQPRFAHPLLASICYEQAAIWKRRAVHATLAEVVTDPEERARHRALAAAGPDAGAASQLDEAAELAASRGATIAAGELSELAAELTPDDPPRARQRRRQAARLYRLGGNSEAAAAILQVLLGEAAPGIERSDVLFELAMTHSAGPNATIELCNEALAEAVGDDSRSSRILAFRSLYQYMGGDVPRALDDARAALEQAERVGDPMLIAAAIARVGQAETHLAEITPGLLERGVELEEQLGLELEHISSSRFFLTRSLVQSGEIVRARTGLQQLAASAAARGDEFSRTIVLFYLAFTEWAGGNLRRALALATEAHEVGTQNDRLWAGRITALIEADLGLVDEARATAQRAVTLAQELSAESFELLSLGVLGRVELARGDLQAAGQYLCDLPDRLLAAGMKDPTLPVWVDAIETLVALGNLDRVRTYIDAHEHRARTTGNRWAAATGARCRGLLAAAEGNAARGLETLEASLYQLETLPLPLERGRTLLSLGSVRRQAQQKKAAREALAEARAIFEGLGAPLWADRANAELRRISGRRSGDDELTETERRVAELAAVGQTNREIAAELYMGLSTVEAHLSRIYRKLGIRSRMALAGQLAARAEAPKARGAAAQT